MNPFPTRQPYFKLEAYVTRCHETNPEIYTKCYKLLYVKKNPTFSNCFHGVKLPLLSYPENGDEDDCKPRLLSCGHVYCTTCLLAVGRDNVISCPECQVQFLACSTCDSLFMKAVKTLHHARIECTME